MANRVEGRTVVITGASAGIGAACARRFAQHRGNLVLLARREERLINLKDELQTASGVAVWTRSLDVCDRSSIAEMMRDLDRDGIVPDILVNNAGIGLGWEAIQDGNPEHWDRMIDTNIKGLLNATRAILPGMVTRNRGHIVNIGSIAGRVMYPHGNVYAATKFAVRALNEAMAIDLVGTMVRVSTVDPGLVETEFFEVRSKGDAALAKKVYEGMTPLSAEDVADAVHYVANAPEHVNVSELVVMPTDQRSPSIVARRGPPDRD